MTSTNLGRSWGEALGENTVAEAMLDRLLHRSVVLNLDGDSYRLRDHKVRSEKLRKATTEPADHHSEDRSRVMNFGEHNC